jgi:hypothetical protein
MYIFHNRLCTTRLTMAIAWDQVIIENTLLAVIIVASIYFERWLGDKAHRRKERKTKKSTIKFIINDLENKVRFIGESRQYKDYKPFFTDMWDAIIMTGRHSLLSFETFRDLQHTYSWMKYYNTELDVKSHESVLKDLLNEVNKSINQSLKKCRPISA